MEIEKQYVEDVYNKIYKHFDYTRYKPWGKIIEFINSLQSGTTILDAGCGNGRNMNLRDDCKFIGFDNSIGQINICIEKGLNVFQSSNLDIKLENNSIDNIISIAVIHHFATEERRLKAIEELIRVCKIGGKILIYVWAKEQERFKNNNNQDQLISWNIKKEFNNNTTEIYDRYYHLFINGELERLCYTFNNIKIIENGYNCGNYYVIIEKIK